MTQVQQLSPQSWIVSPTSSGSQSPAVVVPAHCSPGNDILLHRFIRSPKLSMISPNSSLINFLLRYSGPPGGAVNPGPKLLGRSDSPVTELNLDILINEMLFWHICFLQFPASSWIFANIFACGYLPPPTWWLGLVQALEEPELQKLAWVRKPVPAVIFSTFAKPRTAVTVLIIFRTLFLTTCSNIGRNSVKLCDLRKRSRTLSRILIECLY